MQVDVETRKQNQQQKQKQYLTNIHGGNINEECTTLTTKDKYSFQEDGSVCHDRSEVTMEAKRPKKTAHGLTTPQGAAVYCTIPVAQVGNFFKKQNNI